MRRQTARQRPVPRTGVRQSFGEAGDGSKVGIETWKTTGEGVSGMEPEELGSGWQELSEEVISGMKEWRLDNPKATFAEIETELDLRLAKLRGRMLQDTALASASAGWSGNQPGERPECPGCGRELVCWGKRRRRLQTLGRQEVTLEREYGVCPACGGKLFPPG